MNRLEQEDTTIYKVVVNHEEQYSIWPAGGENPFSWRDAGKTGLKRECLAYIKEVWTDMRPLSLRKKMEETSRRVNDTQTDYPKDACIHHLFEAQMEQMPDAVALIFEDQQLTYWELNRRANQLAHYLQKLGVGPEAKVGICVERSIEMVVGIFGILKAGGAYVPLDPVYPKDRLSLMIQETQVPVLLTQERLLRKLPEHGAQVVCLDTDLPLILEQSEENLNSRTSPASLAYVIYTSGSTGTPKGVMVVHGSLWHYVQDLQIPLGIMSDDVYLHTASIAFSSSVRQLMLPLAQGATVTIATLEERTNPLALLDLLRCRDVTIMDIVPSFLQSCTHALARLEDRARKMLLHNKLRLILTTGEAFPYDVARHWIFAFKHSARLVNMYGATETSGSVAVYPISAKGNDRAKIVPLGRPIANTKIYLLDRDQKPVPAGVVGELYVAGRRVARAYHNRVELTAESFIPDPFGDESGTRLWKTGDLARYLPDGNIEFSGRIDHLISIHGIRIEPEEIEAVLRQHPAIRETVVVARDDLPGEKRLVAYFVPDLGNAPTISELRDLLTEKLPDYMVPSAFVMLNALPRFPNGKINRRALPAPEQKRPDLDQAYVAPRKELHRYLVNLWRDILKLDKIGIHDRFFELGGTSLQAARLVNRLQRELGEFIYIISIFEAPSVAEYAEFLKKNYAQAVAKRFPHDVVPDTKQKPDKVDRKYTTKISASTIMQMRQFIPSRRSYKNGRKAEESKNLPALFILAPPRSGTTLLTIMLAGHPGLFIATELQLLGFDTLSERKAAFTGKFSPGLEGTVRAIMEMKRCDVNEAKRIMKKYENEAYTTKKFYRVLQEWIGERILVDNSTTYAFDLETLKQAEKDFNNALYIHLVSHPYSMILSFESYRIAQVLYLHDHPFSARELGELLWIISHTNISDFLKGVPGHRKFRIRFEDLVTQPQEITEEMCQTLGLEFHPGLLQLYKDTQRKMTDGIYAGLKTKGDRKLNEQQRINPKVADSWKEVSTDYFLGDVTWEMAEALGYDKPPAQRESESGSYGTVRTAVLKSRSEFAERQRQLRIAHRESKK